MKNILQEFVFKKHIQLTHSMSTEEYHNNFGSPAVSLQLHSCKVSALKLTLIS